MKYDILIVGLGNPGDEYAHTRHNVGFMTLDLLAGDAAWEKYHSGDAFAASIRAGKHSVLLLKPMTFMNKSGGAVVVAQKKEKIKPENIVIVHDEVDLPEGTLRIVFGRGSAGHKGVESVQRALKTKGFARLRVGISKATPTGKTKKPKDEEKFLKFIIGEPKKEEQSSLKKNVKKAKEAVEKIIEEGITKAMNEVNSK